jgi:L-malate glycosyltransferase
LNHDLVSPTTPVTGAVRRDLPIRVAFCIDNLNVGGTELNAVRTVERLDRGRFEVVVASLSPTGPLLERYAAAGVDVRPFPIGSLYAAATARRGFELARWLRTQQVDVLHAHDVYSNLFAVPWARLAGVAAIASRRWWEGSPGMLRRGAARAGYALADVALANSEAVGELLAAEGVPRRKIAVVRNFVDPDAFERPPAYRVRELRLELGIGEGERIVGIVANLLLVKDHATLVRAFAQVVAARPGLRLVLVGDGDQRGPLQSLAAELGLRERVIFAGRRHNHPNLHHLFDVSVLCSVSEGLPNSVLEAMAAGRPVVATRVGATADAVEEGTTGLLVPPRDAAALAAALRRLLDDPSRAEAMGEAGRVRARERYSPEASLDTLEQLYTRLKSRSSVSTIAAKPAVNPRSPALR